MANRTDDIQQAVRNVVDQKYANTNYCTATSTTNWKTLQKLKDKMNKNTEYYFYLFISVT